MGQRAAVSHVRECHPCFQLNYCYEANRPRVVEKIVEIAMNGSEVRDTDWVLKISATTVVRYLKKLHLLQVQVSLLPFEQIQDLELICEMDEQWSFVGKKSEQRWL